MRYFVTGCTGFIGIHLCRLLLAYGHQVYGLVRNEKRLPPDLKNRISIVQGDLDLFRNQELVLPPVDVFIHLAAVINANTPEDFMRHNHDSLAHVLDAIKRQSWKLSRFIFASSLAAVGPNPPGEALRETDKPNPVDPYGESKLKAEELLMNQPFPVTVFRPPVVIGPGDPAMLSVFRMVQIGLVPLPSGRPQLLSYIDVDDLTEAIILIANDTESVNRKYFITNEHPVDTRELLREIAASMNRKVIFLPIPRWLMWIVMKCSTLLSSSLRTRNVFDYRTYKQMLTPSFVCTSVLLTNEKGWLAKRSLSETISRTTQGYMQAGWIRCKEVKE